MTNYAKSKIKYGVTFFLHNVLPYLVLLCLIGVGIARAVPRTRTMVTIALLGDLSIAGIGILTQKKLSSIGWILVTILYVLLRNSNFLTPLIAIAIYKFLDETIIEFLYKKWQLEYRELRTLNKHDEDVKKCQKDSEK